MHSLAQFLESSSLAMTSSHTSSQSSSSAAAAVAAAYHSAAVSSAGVGFSIDSILAPRPLHLAQQPPTSTFMPTMAPYFPLASPPSLATLPRELLGK